MTSSRVLAFTLYADNYAPHTVWVPGYRCECGAPRSSEAVSWTAPTQARGDMTDSRCSHPAIATAFDRNRKIVPVAMTQPAALPTPAPARLSGEPVAAAP